MIKGSQHADTTLVVDHAVPHCESRELFKTVIDDEATGVFQGKIIVPPARPEDRRPHDVGGAPPRRRAAP